SPCIDTPVVSKRFSIRIADYYFENAKSPIAVDIRRFLQLDVPRAGVTCIPFHTMIIDLRQEPNALLSKMRHGARYDIRRATEREQLWYDLCQDCTGGMIDELADLYDRVASCRRRSKISRRSCYASAHHGLLDRSRVG